MALLAILLAAVATRLVGLGVPIDLDGYDEGVYWQSLRAMHAGYRLYADIFCSQPPGFLESVYPLYVVLGQGIWAARAGVAALSLLGVVGAYLLGRALSGRWGGLLAAALLATTPLYVQQSRRLEAEGPATALLFVTMAAALLWRTRTSWRGRMASAAGCGVALALGVGMKLLCVTAIVPVLMVAAGGAWHARRDPDGPVRLSLAVAAACACLTALLLVWPFVGGVAALGDQVWSFHIAARAALAASAAGNNGRLGRFFLANAPLAAAALAGVLACAWRRDGRAVPLVGWLLVTLALLARQVPMFPRHAIALLPPLLALAVLGADTARSAHAHRGAAAVAGLLCAASIILGARAFFVGDAARDAGSPGEWERRRGIVRDLRQLTAPDRWVVTDAQFLAGLADRNVPPMLVDTSNVRIDSLYLTPARLATAARDPRTQAVLLATGRLTRPRLAAFRAGLAAQYRLLRAYGAGEELWIRAVP